MTLIEGIVGLIASVIAILGGMYVFARYVGKRFDQWANAIVDNSLAMRNLTWRVTLLERTLKLPPPKEDI